jgi:UDP-glucose 4-epimerase
LAITHADKQIVNIGTGVGTSVNTLFLLLANVTGFIDSQIYADARLGEFAKTYLDIRRAANVLGRKHSVPLSMGIVNTVDYVCKHELTLV